MIAPAPAPDCPAGWTVGLEVLALKAYQSEGDYDDNSDWDAGYRGSIGYDFSDCLFVKATGFGYSTDIDGGNDDYDVDLKAAYIDLVIGQHFTPGDKLTLSPYVGLRWAKFEENWKSPGGNKYEGDFDGLGVVVGIDGIRSLGNNFSIYGTAKQSIVFGNTDYSENFGGDSNDRDSWSTDNVAFVSELGLGVQYDFSFSNVAANVRLGVEGQWWAGVSDEDSENTGLAGFVLGANFRF